MPTANDHQGTHTHKPNWVDISTLSVLAAILVVVSIYTCYAGRQNELTRQAIELNTRPYVKVIFEPTTFALDRKIPSGVANPQTMSIQFSIKNTGKLPACASVQANATWESPSKRREPHAPAANNALGRRFIFPDQENGYLTAYDTRGMTAGDLVNLQNDKKGVFYVAVDVFYGLSCEQRPYVTRTCTAYPIHFEEGHSPTLEAGEPCDENSNYAK